MNITQIITTTLTRFKKFVDNKHSAIKAVQADWEENDKNSGSYIRNKPTSMKANGGFASTVNGIGFTAMSAEMYESLGSYDNKVYILEGEITDGGGSTPSPTPSGNLLDLTRPIENSASYIVNSATSITLHQGANNQLVKYNVTLDQSKTYKFECTSTNNNNAHVQVYTVIDNTTYYHYRNAVTPVNITITGYNNVTIVFYASSDMTIAYNDIILEERKLIKIS